MALDIKNIAEGQLPSSTGDLYTVSASTKTIIKSITLVNTNTIIETINLYLLKSGSSARRIIPKDMQLGVGYSLIFDDVLTLGTGDKIQGDTTTGSKVDYTISGTEET